MLLGNSSIKKPRKKVAALLSNNFGGNTAQSLLSSSPFYAQLTKSLVLQRGTGTPTYTGASAKTVKDHEGVLRTTISGEARFEGARRVRNLLVNTEGSFNNGTTWVKDNSGATNPTITDNYGGVAAPDGTFTASRIQIDRGAGLFSRVQQGAISVASGATFIRSIYARTTDGSTKQVCFRCGSASTNIQPLISITGTWQRFSVTSVAGATTSFEILSFSSVGGDAAFDICVWHPQVEDITGRSDQTTPSAYVSVGALDYRSDMDPLYLDTAGAAAGNASTPDSAATSTTGDIALVFDGALTNWAALNTFASITSGGAGQLGWIFEQVAASTPRLRVFLDGTTQTLIPATTTVSFANGTRGKIAVTRASASGDVKFFTSSDGGSTWTQLGTTVSAAAGALFNSTSNLTINNERTFGPLTGKTYGFQMYSGIPPMLGGSGSATPVVDFNPNRDATTPTGTITSSTTGEVWTLNGASSVVRNATYHGAGVDGVKYFDTDLSGNPIV